MDIKSSFWGCDVLASNEIGIPAKSLTLGQHVLEPLHRMFGNILITITSHRFVTFAGETSNILVNDINIRSQNWRDVLKCV